jgi:hypothetical protein
MDNRDTKSKSASSRNVATGLLQLRSLSLLLASHNLYPEDGGIRSSERAVSFYRNTRRHILNMGTLCTYRCKLVPVLS